MQAERGDATFYNTGAGQFSVSRSGTLAYVPGGLYPAPLTSLVWADHTGAFEPLPLPAGSNYCPRFSPAGKRLVYMRGVLGDLQIWVYDIELETPVRLTTAGENMWPIWSPDGQRVIFNSTVEGQRQIFSIGMDGSREPQRLIPSDASQWPSSCSPDGGVGVPSRREQPGHLDRLDGRRRSSHTFPRDTVRGSVAGVLTGWTLAGVRLG